MLQELGYAICLYVRTCNGQKSYILLYVDDMLIVTHDQNVYEKVTTFHHHVSWRSIAVSWHSDSQAGQFLLNQSACIRRVAAKFGQDKAKQSHISMDSGYSNKQQTEEDPMPRNEEFQSLVGALL